jgi:hypothetical protein
LYLSALCSSQRGDADAAIHSGFKAIEIANSISSQSGGMQMQSSGLLDDGGAGDASAVPSNQLPLVVISCLLLLSDAYKQKNGECESVCVCVCVKVGGLCVVVSGGGFVLAAAERRVYAEEL